MNETLRISPSVQSSMSLVLTEDLHIGNYFILKDTTIVINIHSLHNNPKEW